MNPPDGSVNPFPRRKKQSSNHSALKVVKRGGGPVIVDPPPPGWRVEDIPFGKTIWERRKSNPKWYEKEWEMDAVHAYNRYVTPEYERNSPQPRWIEWVDPRKPHYGDEHATWPGYSQYPGERKRGKEDIPHSFGSSPYGYSPGIRIIRSKYQHWWDKYQKSHSLHNGWTPVTWTNPRWTEVTWNNVNWTWRWRHDRLQ
jgi:hypothetical protein